MRKYTVLAHTSWSCPGGGTYGNFHFLLYVFFSVCLSFHSEHVLFFEFRFKKFAIS